ncbi:MAG: hypothetical protein EAY75_01605 [Bacteroidetes bacterium]|nr:MAG: hypothetical protein EAY75_01605 [Bacteroidota bacterium]
MKNILLIALLPLLLAASCKKDKLADELSKLPPATQTGANTFGCLVNGKAWVPEGSDGNNSNLKIYISGTDFDLRAYRLLDTKSEILVGSVGFTGLGAYELDGVRNSTGVVFDGCSVNRGTTAYRIGQLTIENFDNAKGIISGKFSFNIYHRNCTDTIRITHGRFDKQL